MADEVVSLELDVNVADGAKSVADLKKSIKDLQNAAFAAGEAGDEALSKKYIDAAGAAKDKIGDLKRAIDAAQDSGSKLGAISKVGATIASGFQAAQGAAALFGSAGKDIEQIMLKVQAATALARVGVLDKATLKSFDEACLVKIPHYKAKQIKTKENKTKQNNFKQIKTKQTETKQVEKA